MTTTTTTKKSPLRPDEQVAAVPPRRPGIVHLVVGVVLASLGLWALVGGVVGLVMYSQRDEDGFYMTDARIFQSEGHAIVSGAETTGTGPDVLYGRALVGPVRLAGSTPNPDERLFLGIGPADRVSAYLDGVEHSELVGLNIWPFVADYDEHGGGALAAAPTDQDFWLAAETGDGPLVLETELPAGDWKAVVMNADGSEAVEADLAVGATLPILAWSMLLAFAMGGLMLVGGVALLVSGVRGSRPRRAPRQPRVAEIEIP